MSESIGNSYEAKETTFVRPPQADGGETKAYSIVMDILYPCLILEAEQMPNYMMRVLHNALESLEYGHDKVLDGYYDVYIKMEGQMISLGMVNSNNLKSILQGPVFSPLRKYIMLTPKKRVDGTMMLSLCTSDRY